MSKWQWNNNKYVKFLNICCYCSGYYSSTIFNCSGIACYNLKGVTVAPASIIACSGSAAIHIKVTPPSSDLMSKFRLR